MNRGTVGKGHNSILSDSACSGFKICYKFLTNQILGNLY